MKGKLRVGEEVYNFVVSIFWFTTFLYWLQSYSQNTISEIKLKLPKSYFHNFWQNLEIFFPEMNDAWEYFIREKHNLFSPGWIYFYRNNCIDKACPLNYCEYFPSKKRSWWYLDGIQIVYVHSLMSYKDLYRTLNPYVKLKISEDQTIF